MVEEARRPSSVSHLFSHVRSCKSVPELTNLPGQICIKGSYGEVSLHIGSKRLQRRHLLDDFRQNGDASDNIGDFQAGVA
jgi:hypothetical protein